MWEDVFKPMGKVLLVLFLPFVLMLPVVSCQQRANEEKRAEQARECRAQGGEYLRSTDPNASPYRDFCKIP